MPPADTPLAKPAAKRSAETAARDEERRKRLAAALRENLKRRKGPQRDDAAEARETEG